MPKSITLQVEERQGKISPPIERQSLFPVPGEQFAQVGGELYQVGLDLTLLEQIQDRKQQQRLVRCPIASGFRPASTTLIGS